MIRRPTRASGRRRSISRYHYWTKTAYERRREKERIGEGERAHESSFTPVVVAVHLAESAHRPVLTVMLARVVESVSPIELYRGLYKRRVLGTVHC